MSNLRVVLSVAVTVGTFVFAAVACDDTDLKSGFDDTAKDGGDGPETGSFFTDSGDSDTSLPVKCSPSLPATFVPKWTPPTKAAVCSSAKLAEYYDACLADLGNQEPDATSPCTTWTAANTECAACIEAPDNTGPIQWNRGSDYDYYTLNLAGCLALERNELEDGKCPATYAASIQCQRESCEKCFVEPNATFDDFQACQTGAKSTACGTLNAKVGEVCGTTYNDPDGGAYDCFRRGTAEDAKTHFVRVEGIFCGQ